MGANNITPSYHRPCAIALGIALLASVPGFAQDCPHREYAWTRTVGGEQGDYLLGGVAVDIHDNVLIAGEFEGKVDFDPGPGKDNRRPKGMGDAYVSWYRPDGAYGGTYTFGATRGAEYLFNWALSIDKRPLGGFVVGGLFNGKTDFDPTDGKDARAPEGENDAFVAAFRQDFSYDWTWTAGSNAYEDIWAIAVDSAGSVYAAGTYSDHLWLGEGDDRRKLISNGDLDVLVVKLSASGGLLWFRGFGGPERDFPYSLAVDSLGNVVIAGGFRGTVDFDPLGTNVVRNSNGGEDVFVLKLSTNGEFDWLKTFGASKRDNPRGIVVRPDDGLYVGGAFNEVVDFNPDGGGDLHDSAPASYHAFVTHYGSDGAYQWSRTFGGGSNTYVKSLAFSGERLILTGGYFSTVDLDPGEGTDERPVFGARSNYVSYWSPEGAYLLGDVFGGAGLDRTMGLAADSQGNVYVGGDFNSPVADFDPTGGVHEAASHGGYDIFLTKFNCGLCDYVDRHDVSVDEGKVRSDVYTLIPDGKVTIVLASADGGIKKSKRTEQDGTARVSFADVVPGDYECSIRRIRDSDGSKLCSGTIAARRVTVP